MDNGEVCVMILLMIRLLLLCVDNLDMLQMVGKYALSCSIIVYNYIPYYIISTF